MSRNALQDDAGHRRHRQRSAGADRDDADRDQPRQSERAVINIAVSFTTMDNRPATTDSEPVRPTLGAIQDTWGALV